MRFLPCLILLISPVSLAAQVILTEVMFDPSGNERTDEFIEIFNAGTDTVDLRGYRIGDQFVQETLAFPDSLFLLSPGQFAVIFDLDYFAGERRYAEIIPDAALQIAINDRTFGSGGLSNSRAETIVLIDAPGDTLAMYTYSPDNPPGHSDEKIELTADDRPSNWGNSLVLLGTPGAANSISPKNFDLALRAAETFVQPTIPRRSTAVRLHFLVENRGRRRVKEAVLSVQIADSIALAPAWVPALDAGSQREVVVDWLASVAGTVKIGAVLHAPDDQESRNDSLTQWLAIAYPEGAVLINEVMFQPRADEPEWIEIYNTTDEMIDLYRWRLRDQAQRTGLVIDSIAGFLPPHGFGILTADALVSMLYAIPPGVPVVELSGFPNLNNSAETLSLLDFSGASIDSVIYFGGIGSGISLERIRLERASVDTTNWAPSRDPVGATPGKDNSVRPALRDLAVDAGAISWQPEQPVRGQSVEIIAAVRNVGRLQVAAATVHLFADLNGDGLFAENERVAVAGLENALPVDARAELVLRWAFEQAGYLDLGVVAEMPEDLRAANDSAFVTLPVGFLPADVIMNEVMSAPTEGEAEWVEIYNNANVAVNLRGLQLADERSVSSPLPVDAWLSAGDYYLLAEDSSVQRFGVPFGVLPRWPGLNNDGEPVRILDFYGQLVDSVVYPAVPGELRGISLERINPRLSGIEASTWGASADPQGATPGRRNALFASMVVPGNRLKVEPNPFSPDSDGYDDMAIIAYELPLTQSQVNLFVYDLRGRLVRRILNNARSGQSKQVVFDGRDDEGRPLPAGLYILYLHAIDAGNGRQESAKAILILAKKL